MAPPLSADLNSIAIRLSLGLPFQGVRKLTFETPSGIPTGLAASDDLFRASSVLSLQKQTFQHPTYLSIKTAKPNHTNQRTN